MTQDINEMKRWLKYDDPDYGGKQSWINKINHWPTTRIYAVYMGRQETLKRRSKKEAQEKKFHQITMDEIFDMTTN